MMKYMNVMGISLFMVLSNLSPALAQEDNEGSAVKRKQNIKKVTQVQKKKKSNYRIETDTRVGWSSNVYRTPDSFYKDPETGAMRKSSATEAFFVNPDIEFAYIPHEGKSSKLEFEYSWEGIFFPGGGTLKNAEGYHHKFLSEFEYDFVDGNSKTPSNNSVVQKSSMRVQIYSQEVDYNYLHRGTGKLRNTKVAKVDEENRYQHTESGAYLDFKNRFSSGTSFGLSVGTYERDYKDVVTLQSYDREGFETEIKGEQELGSEWAVFAKWNEEKMEYDRHRASNTVGNSVNGTKRKFTDTETAAGLEYDGDDLQSRLEFSNLKRDDLFVGYWTYDQEEVSLSVAKEWKSFGRLKLEGSSGKRDYKLETNSFGKIRDRKVESLEFGWDREYKWGTLSAKISQLDQDDTDSYYQYKSTVAYVGLEKEF